MSGTCEEGESVDEAGVLDLIRGYSDDFIKNTATLVLCKITAVARGHLEPGSQLYHSPPTLNDKLQQSQTSIAKIMDSSIYSGPTYQELSKIQPPTQIGFLTSAWFSKNLGKYAAIGYVKLTELSKLDEKTALLSKSPSSLQLYHVTCERISEDVELFNHT